MMRYFVIIQLFWPVVLYSQNNLVPNPGFELYSNCPSNLSQINNATHWFQPFIGGVSTDYFHQCSTNTLSGIPSNYFGYQYAHNGIGYAGIQTWSGTFNIREYLEIELTDSLIQGSTYCVSMYISLPESFKMGTDGIGAYFSSNSIYYSAPFFGVLNYQPQIQNPIANVITDTSKWAIISDSFIAVGGEKYVTIGNFRDDNQTTTSVSNNNGLIGQSYFYIDDVSVVQGNCIISVPENNNNPDEIVAYPNPTTGIVEFNNVNGASIEVIDYSGRTVLKIKNQNKINLEQLENGSYFIKFTSISGKTNYGKIILNK